MTYTATTNQPAHGKIDPRGALGFGVANLKHDWESPDSYGVDAIYQQFKHNEETLEARGFCFIRGEDAVTVSFKTLYRLMAKYRNCDTKYDSYSIQYTEAQLTAGIHGRIWFRMTDDGRAMQIKLSQPYLGTKEHTIPDESASLEPAPVPYAVSLPAGWVDEAALRTALQLANKQIAQLCFIADTGTETARVTVDKKLVADFLKAGKGLEYRIRIDPEPYTLTLYGKVGQPESTLAASIRLEYRATGYKGVAHIGDSHLPPADAAAVQTVYTLALPPAKAPEPKDTDYQQPCMLDMGAEETVPVVIPNPEVATILSDSALMLDIIAPAAPIRTSYDVAHALFCEAWNRYYTIKALQEEHAQPGEFPGRYDTLLYHTMLQVTRRQLALHAVDPHYNGTSQPWYWADEWTPAPIPNPTSKTITSDSEPASIKAEFAAHLDTCYSCRYNQPCSTKRDIRARLDALQAPVPQPPLIPGDNAVTRQVWKDTHAIQYPELPEDLTPYTLAEYTHAFQNADLRKHMLYCDDCRALLPCDGADTIQRRMDTAAQDMIDALQAPTPQQAPKMRQHTPARRSVAHSPPSVPIWKWPHANNSSDTGPTSAPREAHARRSMQHARPPPADVTATAMPVSDWHVGNKSSDSDYERNDRVPHQDRRRAYQCGPYYLYHMVHTQRTGSRASTLSLWHQHRRPTCDTNRGTSRRHDRLVGCPRRECAAGVPAHTLTYCTGWLYHAGTPRKEP